MAALNDFLGMGGYAAYVWSAFGFAAVVLVGLLWQSWRAARQREAEFEQLKAIARPAAGEVPPRRRLARRAVETRPAPATSGEM